MNHILKIYLVEVAIFDDFDGTYLTEREFDTDEERFRVCFAVDGTMFDYKTKQQVFPLNLDYHGLIEPPVYSTRMYIKQYQEDKLATEQELVQCIERYNEIVEETKMREENGIKLILGRRLF